MNIEPKLLLIEIAPTWKRSRKQWICSTQNNSAKNKTPEMAARELAMSEEKRILTLLRDVNPHNVASDAEKYSLSGARIVGLYSPEVGDLDFPTWFSDMDRSFRIEAKYDLIGETSWSCKIEGLAVIGTGDRPFVCHLNCQAATDGYIQNIEKKVGIENLVTEIPELTFTQLENIEDFSEQRVSFPILIR